MIHMIFIKLYNKFMEKIVKNLLVIVNGNGKKKKRKENGTLTVTSIACLKPQKAIRNDNSMAIYVIQSSLFH